jgi:hypothetical protein
MLVISINVILILIKNVEYSFAWINIQIHLHQIFIVFGKLISFKFQMSINTAFVGF